MHIIIVGSGRTGKHVIEAAVNDKHDVFVIEKDKETADWAASNFDCVVIHADATSIEALEEAKAGEADSIIVTTDDDAINSLVLLLAKEQGVKQLVSSVNDEERLDVFKHIGTDIIESPFRLSAKHLYRAVQGPNVNEFLDLGDGFEILELEVEPDSEISGQTIKKLKKENKLPGNTLIVLIKREDDFIIPDGSAEMKEKDVLVVLAKSDKVEDISNLFGDKKNQDD
ncbi:potassium channel family protein [Psychroflexus sediminis]|uniref:Trk system potassium uptake protein TrkA n=1 Tax=Psychroflexus sediminis TaxID=470826 RepID=A0A1G7XCA3_9FLAO|nr:TrkA family potassium uptake protein [Psychroflexus sediminis]SDG81743.1 trk system potassium uptake protein TrkA [Psychroflexus sediminis]